MTPPTTPKPTANGRVRYQITMSRPAAKILRAIQKRENRNRSNALEWLIERDAKTAGLN